MCSYCTQGVQIRIHYIYQSFAQKVVNKKEGLPSGRRVHYTHARTCWHEEGVHVKATTGTV